MRKYLIAKPLSIFAKKNYHRCLAGLQVLLWHSSTEYVIGILNILLLVLFSQAFQEAVTRRVLWIKVFLKISLNSQENTCARFSVLIKLQTSILLKKRLWRRCFSVNFKKFFRTAFLTEQLRVSAFPFPKASSMGLFLQIALQSFNIFPASILVLYPLKISENERFSGVFRGMKWEH